MNRGKKKRRGIGYPDKRQAQVVHAQRRFAERYGVGLSALDMRQLVCQITSGKATLLERQSRHVSVWAVRFDGEILPVVYDRERHVIVSALPQTDPRYVEQLAVLRA